MSPRHFSARFKPPVISEIETERIRFKSAGLAPLTVISYERDFRVFRAWCAAADRDAMPASSDTVELYIVDLLRLGRKVSTLERHAAGIQHFHRAQGHPTPCGAPVRALLAGARRVLAQRPAQKAALSAADLRRIVRATGTRSAMAARDVAILLFGWASALRRANLARMQMADLTFDRTGVLVWIDREKQDRKGGGRVAAVGRGSNTETCPVRALQRWVKLRGDAPGPVFCHVMRGQILLKPLLGNRIGQIVQAAVARIGLDRACYGAHSLRAGCVTEALTNGANEIDVARHTAHRSLSTLNLYMRQRNPWRGHIGKFLGL